MKRSAVSGIVCGTLKSRGEDHGSRAHALHQRLKAKRPRSESPQVEEQVLFSPELSPDGDDVDYEPRGGQVIAEAWSLG